MHRIWRHIGIAAVVASSVAFAQGNPLPAAPSTGPAGAAQPDLLTKVTSSVKDAYSNIDQAKSVLSGKSSPTQTKEASQLLGKAENDLGTAKSALPAGTQQQGGTTSMLDTVQQKVASAKDVLHTGNVQEAQKLLGEVPPIANVEKSLTSKLGGVPGIGGAGSSMGIPSGGAPTK